MKMNEVIRKYRKERGLTQEQVAGYLGVSTPAVNKWESGSSYPDLTLIPALARLAGRFKHRCCFQENLSEQEIAAFANQVYETMHQQGFACGLRGQWRKYRSIQTVTN